MVFLLLLSFSIFFAGNLPIAIVNQSELHDCFISKNNINTLDSMIATARTTGLTDPKKITIALEKFDSRRYSYKENLMQLKSLMEKNPDNTDYKMSLQTQMNLKKKDCLGLITSQTHLMSFAYSLTILLLKKYCHHNALFLLAASLTIPYYLDHNYFKEKNNGSWLKAIPDFAVFATLVLLLYGINRVLMR